MNEETRNLLMSIAEKVAEHTGNTALRDHIASAKKASEIQNMMGCLLPSPDTASRDERKNEICADVREYFELVASGMKTFMEAHVQKYGESVLDTEFVQRMRERRSNAEE